MLDSKAATLLLVVIAIVLIVICVWLATGDCRKCSNSHEMELTPHLMTVMPSGLSGDSKAYAKSETLPVFLRGDDRIIVTAPRIKAAEINLLPRAFDGREEWKGWLTPVQDQGECGSCWSFSACSVFGDRIKIATGASVLTANDTISPYTLAACMKCKAHGRPCHAVCDGHYMDEVMEYFRTHGAYALSAIKKFTNYGTQYICYKPRSPSEASPFKAKRGYRVNSYTMGELKDPERLRLNELQIMHDIHEFGPVTCTIKVFDPLNKADLHKNFYLYKTGVYGYPWDGGDPSIYDGYHALSIIGWGVENVDGQDVKYWILRNSWGPEWGIDGYGKILKGENRAIVETDVWAPGY